MTKTKVNERKRVTIKLNSLVVNKMVQDIMKNYGQRCHVNETALNSLKEAAERFLESMWKQLRQLSHIDQEHGGGGEISNPIYDHSTA